MSNYCGPWYGADSKKLGSWDTYQVGEDMSDSWFYYANGTLSFSPELVATFDPPAKDCFQLHNPHMPWWSKKVVNSSAGDSYGRTGTMFDYSFKAMTDTSNNIVRKNSDPVTRYLYTVIAGDLNVTGVSTAVTFRSQQ